MSYRWCRAQKYAISWLFYCTLYMYKLIVIDLVHTYMLESVRIPSLIMIVDKYIFQNYIKECPHFFAK